MYTELELSEQEMIDISRMQQVHKTAKRQASVEREIEADYQEEE